MLFWGIQEKVFFQARIILNIDLVCTSLVFYSVFFIFFYLFFFYKNQPPKTNGLHQSIEEQCWLKVNNMASQFSKGVVSFVTAGGCSALHPMYRTIMRATSV